MFVERSLGAMAPPEHQWMMGKTVEVIDQVRYLEGVLARTPEENLLDRALVKALIEGLKKPNA